MSEKISIPADFDIAMARLKEARFYLTSQPTEKLHAVLPIALNNRHDGLIFEMAEEIVEESALPKVKMSVHQALLDISETIESELNIVCEQTRYDLIVGNNEKQYVFKIPSENFDLPEIEKRVVQCIGVDLQKICRAIKEEGYKSETKDITKEVYMHKEEER